MLIVNPKPKCMCEKTGLMGKSVTARTSSRYQTFRNVWRPESHFKPRNGSLDSSSPSIHPYLLPRVPASVQRWLSPGEILPGRRSLSRRIPGGRAGGRAVIGLMNKAPRWAGTVSVFLELPARRASRTKSRLRSRRAWLLSLSPEGVRVVRPADTR